VKPIILNLIVEEQLAKEANVRDPVKIAGLLGACLLLVVAGVGYFLNWRSDAKAQEALALQRRFDAATAQAAEGTGDLRTWRLLANDVVAINNTRSLFAWQLAWVKDVVPETILLRSVNMTVVAEAGGALPTPMDVSAGKVKVPRAATTERVLLRLEGQAVCAKPEIEVDEFIKSMKNHPGIKDNMERVELRSIARSNSGPGEPPIAQFVIECQYKGVPL
jgi:hypothetical protein